MPNWSTVIIQQNSVTNKLFYSCAFLFRLQFRITREINPPTESNFRGSLLNRGRFSDRRIC